MALTAQLTGKEADHIADLIRGLDTAVKVVPRDGGYDLAITAGGGVSITLAMEETEE